MTAPLRRPTRPADWPDPGATATLSGLGFALVSPIWPALGRGALAACSLALAAGLLRRSERRPRARPDRYLGAAAAAAIAGWCACLALGAWPVWPRALLLAASTAAVTYRLRHPGAPP